MTGKIPSDSKKDIDEEVNADTEAEEDGQWRDQDAKNDDQTHESMSPVWPPICQSSIPTHNSRRLPVNPKNVMA